MDSEGYSSAQTENLTPRETTALPKRKRCWKGKRFSDEQIKSLESIFKLETKLEAKKKLQLARELGLQPRQIAIWFQNRRARWKSKQIEEDYRGLKASFDSLSMQFESLKQEKESLLTQLERLSDLLRSPNDDGHSGSKDSEENGTSNGPEEEDKNIKSIKEGLDHHEVMYTNDNEAGSSELFHKDSSGVIKNTEQKEEPESFKFGEYKDTSLASPEEWRNLDLGGLFTQSCGTSKWWEF